MLTEFWSDLRFRLRAVFRRDAVERELDDELRFHLEREAAKHERTGMSHDDALRQARLAFGGVNRIKDDSRDVRGVSFFDALTRDVHYAIRGLRARRGFTAAVVVTLGLGIGINAAMFGVLDRLLLRAPDHLIEPARVNRVYAGWIERGQLRRERNFEYLTLADLSRWTTGFDAKAAFAYRQVAVGTGEDVRPQTVAAVSASFFNFFDTQPVVGRFFTASEDVTPSGAAVAVLTYEYWQTRYAGRADAIGATLKIDRGTYTVIGVASQGFVGIADQQTPVAFIPVTTFAATINPRYYANYNWGWLEMLVRRKPGVSIETATAELTNAYQRSWLAQMMLSPGALQPLSVARPSAIAGHLSLGRGPQSGPEARVVVWMSGVAVMVLLIACANVANLLLVRSLRRRRELALRTALGGTRARLIQQLLTETVVLALLGGVAGVVAAQWGGGALRRMFLDSAERSGVISDPRTLVFGLAVTLGAAFAAGLAPAFQLTTARTADSLKAGSREGAYAHSRARSLLLVLQAAVSVVLLVGAGLFVRSVREVRAIRLGYDVDPVLVVQVNWRDANASGDGESARLQRMPVLRRMLDEARATSGVTNASYAVTVPFYSSEGRGLWVPGVDSVRKLGRFTLQIASPEYFATMGTRILRGRGITADDRQNAPHVVVVSEAMANVLWPGRDAIGQCIAFNAEMVPCITVVGVAENIRGRSLTGSPEFHYYLPTEQFAAEPLLMVRVAGRGADHADAVRQHLQRLMPGSAYVTVIPMTAIMAPRVRSWQYGATMFVAFGGLALALAAIGLYAVVAFAVAQRTHELGLRIALGAQMGDMLRLVMGEGIGFALAGVALGFGIALAAGSRVSPLLYGVSVRDPLTYAAVAGLLIAVAAIASAVPAMRAARVDPNVALRTE